LRKTKIDDVTPAKAGVQSEKAGFPLEFIPYTTRGGNDKYTFRNKNYLTKFGPKSQVFSRIYGLYCLTAHMKLVGIFRNRTFMGRQRLENMQNFSVQFYKKTALCNKKSFASHSVRPMKCSFFTKATSD
jgi:hypothetical protein